ncbi:bifunctional diaminohydroxyphosphoribosylaminopyrimidine deaminase/5-amino-6-(5-phosphoribosylamino)uracil reductase RibD [Rhizobium sp. TRM95796]|uniref:bifunctional diaminohydroxyphosphoribosylaminopyrimidine deaminase/5-amino-6-(5-phosphoribosylamino)uracil reductase RibD n=1 Tax=Rhizobium sp. TRM95796 TaxID=2979862 RepID=UPI0021E6FCEF|nr:bifunctional diaminohydroxyphosphoribosylaminopyrimidine deaminase/5-amino-6-(5-phosphoribosylamino)uracil reductase RibD [Rhizobium sp. TRM95796]MCV3765360.1 bifunctional diaminohydroxyphosphoribosylaminopyrimidine deaminase/5-amino-6-(5-phosphoribosylamino)uracil reductase RibD [Rhizobium sp. TRM95796]
MSSPADDQRFMSEAAALSRRHLGLTGSNPSVGCVIVRDGEIVGRGVTAASGRPHAETEALKQAGEQARGATAYVTLEPCSHHGKTPPCAEALIAAGVARVVVAITDPDERVSGRGLAMLEAAGIKVVSGVGADEAHAVLEAYLHRQRNKRPQVILKLAVSADGMIGRRGEGQVAITGKEARARSQLLRAESDAILVGSGTAMADDPELTCRLPGEEHRSPIRLVLDRRLELPLGSRLATTARAVPVIAVTNRADAPDLAARRAALENAGVEVLQASDLGALLDELGRRGISSLIVEGGARVATDFLGAGLADRILLFTSPVVVGEGGVPSPLTEQTVPASFHLRSRKPLGADWLADYIRAETSDPR